MQFYFDDNLEMKVHLIIMKTFSTIKKNTVKNSNI